MRVCRNLENRLNCFDVKVNTMAAASVAAQNLGFDGTVIFVLNIQPLIIVFFL